MVFTIMSFDSYGHNNGKFWFCRSCFHYIQKLNIPKFGVINVVNIYPCQDYPNVLKDFIIVEKVVITCTYLVISILKLRLSGSKLSSSYQQIRGHAVVLLQNYGPLLDFLSSNTFQLHKIIRIV